MSVCRNVGLAIKRHGQEGLRGEIKAKVVYYAGCLGVL
jgi:hypothetical protein